MTELFFKTHTLLKNLVGKDLINDDNIAIVELVKNSYDARSKEVTLKFEDFSDNKTTNTNSSKIIIADKGIGMDENDVIDKWLNIAFSEKKVGEQEEGAYFAGNKGIGRFSCDRLGSKLDLITRKKNDDLIHLSIDWKDFENEGDKDLTIQEIPMDFNIIDESKAIKLSGMKKIPKTGTILVISKLRSLWGKDELQDLKRNLEKFINPNQLFLQNKFEIEIIAEEFKLEDEFSEYHEQINGLVKNLIFDKLKFNTTYIESIISEDGSSIKTDLFHDGEAVFKVTEKNINYPELKGTRLVLYYLNPYKKAYFKRQTGVRSVDFGSVFLFLNGFRVAPYGERGNDWLGLDVRKNQGKNRFLSSREIIGRVEVADNEDRFKPISSREGLKLTPEFANLKDKYFLDVLRRLERFVVKGLDWDSIPKNLQNELLKSDGLDWENTSEKYVQSWDRKKKRISLTIMSLIGLSRGNVENLWFNSSLLSELSDQKSEEVNKLISNIEGFDGDVVDQDLKKNLKKIGKIVADKEEEIRKANEKVSELTVETEDQQEVIQELEKESESYQAQTLFLKSITSLDKKSLLKFHHQICFDSDLIDNYIAKTMNALRDKNNIKEALKNIEKISRANKRIMSTAQYATKANFTSGTKKDLTDLPSYFEQYLNNVAKDFTAAGINLTIVNTVTKSFEIKVKKIELSMLIDNIISNADKAHAKNIYISMTSESENNLIISFKDDGKGLDNSINIENVFDLGVTSTTGSGLGLFHVKEIMNSLDAEIEFIPRQPEKGIEIRMTFIK